MVSQTRAQRIAERIREELSEMLVQELSDPRLARVSVTEVTVDRELAYASVYVSALEGEVRAKEIIAGLRHADGFIRRELSQRIDLRSFPKLRYHWDPTYERAERIETLLAELHNEEEKKLASQEAASGEEDFAEDLLGEDEFDEADFEEIEDDQDEAGHGAV